MSRTDSVFLICCIALIACAAAYHWHPSGPRYYPREHTWRTEKLEDEPSMGWYWRSGWAFGVAAAAALGTWVALRAASGKGDPEVAGPSTGLPSWAYTTLTVAVLAALTAVSVQIVDHYFTHWHTWGPWDIPG